MQKDIFLTDRGKQNRSDGVYLRYGSLAYG